MSAGTMSPIRSATTSPGTSRVTSTLRWRPSRQTTASRRIRSCSCSTAIAARYSLTKPSPTLSATMTAMMMAPAGSPVRPETPAATSSRSSRGLRSWPQSTARARTRCKPTTLGPYRSSRPAASAADRPESLLPSRFSTSCGAAAAAVARSIPVLGATASARLVTVGSWARSIASPGPAAQPLAVDLLIRLPLRGYRLSHPGGWRGGACRVGDMWPHAYGKAGDCRSADGCGLGGIRYAYGASEHTGEYLRPQLASCCTTGEYHLTRLHPEELGQYLRRPAGRVRGRLLDRPDAHPQAGGLHGSGRQCTKRRSPACQSPRIDRCQVGEQAVRPRRYRAREPLKRRVPV